MEGLSIIVQTPVLLLKWGIYCKWENYELSKHLPLLPLHYTSTFTPSFFSRINSWEKALKSPKIQAYFGCSGVASPNHDINDFDGIPRKFGVVYIQFSIFIQNSMGEKRGETGISFIKKMLLIPLCFPKQTVRHHFFFFFVQFKYIKAFWGVFFKSRTVRSCEMYRVILFFFVQTSI